MNEQFYFADISSNEAFIVEEDDLITEDDGYYTLIDNEKRYIHHLQKLSNVCGNILTDNNGRYYETINNCNSIPVDYEEIKIERLVDFLNTNGLVKSFQNDKIEKEIEQAGYLRIYDIYRKKCEMSRSDINAEYLRLLNQLVNLEEER